MSQKLNNCYLCGSPVRLRANTRINGHGDYSDEICCTDFDLCGLRWSPYKAPHGQTLIKLWNLIGRVICQSK